MSDSIVEQLLAGSRNMDRMRKEIDLIVSMMLGIISEYSLGDQPTVFSSSSCKWTISLQRQNMCAHCDIICCIGGEEDCLTPYAYCNWEPRDTKSYLVQHVHESLSVLVNGIAEAFPDAKVRWQPLLNAAASAS